MIVWDIGDTYYTNSGPWIPGHDTPKGLISPFQTTTVLVKIRYKTLWWK